MCKYSRISKVMYVYLENDFTTTLHNTCIYTNEVCPYILQLRYNLYNRSSR